jgi:ribosomal protein S18 acetylase RimI-like enzyme
MITRSIGKHEIESFIQLYADSDDRYWLNRLFENKGTRPEWCFVIEKDGTHLGSVVYFQFEGNDSELCAFGLALPWQGDYVKIGEKLLDESAEHVKTQTLQKIEFRCDTDDTYHKEMRDVLQAGFELTQDKHCYVLTDFDTVYDYDKQLVFKTLDQVGEERFIDAIKHVTVDTLDRADQSDVDTLGAEEAAKDYYTILKSIDDNPQQWVLAYDTNDHLIGLVVAQNLSEKTGCINYIGVVPEYRGNNYSKDLVIKATELLGRVKSVERIVAEVDARNFPLEKTLGALQFKKSKTMWVYHKRF